MSRYSLLIFFILFETLQTVLSGEESFNPFGPQVNKKSGLEEAEISEGKEFNYESNEVPSDEKIIEKRRLYFNEEEANSSPVPTDRHPENNEFSERRRTNFSEPENKPQTPEFQQRFGNWDNEKNRFSLMGQGGNFRNPEEIRSRQSFVGHPSPTQRYDWEKKGDNSGKGHPLWNEENKFKSFENLSQNQKMGSSYNGRTPGMFNNNDMNSYSEERNQDLFNRRVPITTLNDREMGFGKNYNDRMGENYREMGHERNYNERMGDMNSGFVGHPHTNYYNKNPPGFWSSNFNTPEKGVIINFNTECPKPRHFSDNQLVHKFIFTPKTSLETFQDDLISSPKITPMYYL